MVNLVKIISTKITKMRRKVKFLRFGKSDVQECAEAMPFGVDAVPIKDTIAVYAATSDRANPVIIGYIPVNQIAQAGEHRIYSVDSDGAVKFAIHLKNDGTAEIGGASDNMVRYSELKKGFDQLKSDFNTFLTSYNTHVHPGVQSGNSSTSPTTTQGQSSQASIDASKINEIKTK